MINSIWDCVLLLRNYTAGGNLHHINHTTRWLCVSERCIDLDLCKYWYNCVCEQAKSFPLFRAWCLSCRVTETLQVRDCVQQSAYSTSMHCSLYTFLQRSVLSSRNCISDKKSALIYYIWHLPLRRASWHSSLSNASQKCPPESLSRIHDLDFNWILERQLTVHSTVCLCMQRTVSKGLTRKEY